MRVRYGILAILVAGLCVALLLPIREDGSPDSDATKVIPNIGFEILTFQHSQDARKNIDALKAADEGRIFILPSLKDYQLNGALDDLIALGVAIMVPSNGEVIAESEHNFEVEDKAVCIYRRAGAWHSFEIEDLSLYVNSEFGRIADLRKSLSFKEELASFVKHIDLLTGSVRDGA